MKKRRRTRKVFIGKVGVGGNAPVSVQSMTKGRTEDEKSLIREIRLLEKAGCEIIRVAVPDWKALRAVKNIRRAITIPLVADIHFSPELALAAIAEGVDALRINPGNITRDSHIKKIFRGAKKKGIPVRVGVNAGSLPKRFSLHAHRDMTALAEKSLSLGEDVGFMDLIVSLKAYDIGQTIAAYRALASRCPYPFHLGITESGPKLSGTVRSSIGIGCLLREGIGDTIRVSLSAPALEEVRVAKEILKALDLREFGLKIVSCPTCGRCRVDLFRLLREFEKRVNFLKSGKELKVAVMGCAVNGPGEAKEADVGIAMAENYGWLFRKGKKIRKVPKNRCLDVLTEEVKNFVANS